MKKLRNSNKQNNNKSFLSKFGRKPGKQNTSVLLIAILLFALVGASFLVRSFAATASIYITPANANVSLGSTLTIDIRENSSTEIIDTVEANLTYDATKLQFLSIDASNSAFDLGGPSSSDGNGSISIVRAKTVTSLTNDQLVASVSFRLIGTGTTPVSFASSSKIIRTSDKVNVLTVMTPASYTINDTSAPTVPSGLTADTRTVNSIAFSWTASTDNNAVTGYKIYRGGVQIGTTASTNYTHTGLTPNTPYSYTVAAYDNVPNTSAQSSPPLATSTLADTTAPTVPLNLTVVTRTVNSIAFSWSASADNVLVTGYKIYRGGVQIGTTASTNYTHTGLTPNTPYSYTVAAYDNVPNTSAQSSPPLATSTLADTVAPDAPQGLSSPSQTTSSITLAWNASMDNVGVVGYNILRNGLRINTSASTGFTDTGLTQGTQYTYTVTAYDLVPNTSPISNTLITTTKVKAGDINGDGVVNAIDLSILANNWGGSSRTRAQGDLNGDTVVNAYDLSILANNWGT